MFIRKVIKCFIFIILPSYITFFILFEYDFIHSHTGDDSEDMFQKIKFFTNCTDNPVRYELNKRGNYWVLYNYMISSKRSKCEESVTYTTHSDHTLLDNLIPLLNRWQGPISVALHAPGSDFKPILESLVYLRNCIPLIKEYVTFHMFFPDGHSPKEIPSHDDVMTMTYNCSLNPPFQTINRTNTYVAKNRLLYPINVGRNVARSMAETHYVLTSDIELYPSSNLISRFLEMISESGMVIHATYYPAVFTLHVFEIEDGVRVPETKTELQKLFKHRKAVPFHVRLCVLCHRIPQTAEWKKGNESQHLQIFNVAKRTGRYRSWEPFYIGTKAEPPFDEDLSWEGMRNKMSQAFKMCLMNYSFLILDNAFLIHRPGIKKSQNVGWRSKYMGQNNKIIRKTILPEIARLYGNNSECTL